MFGHFFSKLLHLFVVFCCYTLCHSLFMVEYGSKNYGVQILLPSISQVKHFPSLSIFLIFLHKSLIYEYLPHVDTRKRTNTLNLYIIILMLYLCTGKLHLLEKTCFLLFNSFLFIEQCEITAWRRFSPILKDLHEMDVNTLYNEIIQQLKAPLK